MSTTVTPSPPRGQVASAGRGAGGQSAPRTRRRWLRLPRASTTPGKLWLVRAGLVLGCLAWGALAALMVSQHALAAHDVSANDEALSLDTLNLISRTGDANFQKDFSAAQSKLSTLLSSASAQSVLALLMAVGCAWGLTVRLTEYR